MNDVALEMANKKIAALTQKSLEDLGGLCTWMHKALRNEGRKKILLALQANGPMTRRELIETGGAQTESHLNCLLAARFVSRESERPFRYSINDFLMELLDLKLSHDEQRKQKKASV